MAKPTTQKPYNRCNDLTVYLVDNYILISHFHYMKGVGVNFYNVTPFG